MCLEGCGEEVEGVSSLLAAGFDDGEERFDEAAAAFALGAERQCPPDDRVTQRLLRAVVGRFDTGDVGEGPELVEAVEQTVAQRDRRRVGTLLPLRPGCPPSRVV